MKPTVALLSDFGTRDHYVGAMKAVVLGICAEATLVDITHDIAPHDILTASLELAACYRFFPPGTVFLVVVDPGVGSNRRGIAADTGDYKFVAPDNGVLTAIFQESAPRKIVELTERRYARPTVSRTFEGRDRFAPAAGWLAKGADVTVLGRPVADYRRLDIPQPRVEPESITGEVLRVDRFGNLITNIDRRTLDRMCEKGRVRISIGAEGRHQSVERLVDTYADIPPDVLCGLFGSTDHLEIALNAASAAERYGLTRGTPVSVSKA